MAECSSSSASSSTTAAEKVAANSDLVTEILIRLPTKSLRSFRSVSKHWLSIITSHFFALLRNPDSTIVSGLFFLPNDIYNPFPEINFVPIINTIESPTHNPQPRFKDLAFVEGLADRIRILNSCQGLLLCCFGHDHDDNPKHNYCILNPTTNQFKILPKCYASSLICPTLAFDPSKSPHYKVVGICYTNFVPTYRIIIYYSSETGTWKGSSVPFEAKDKTHYDAGVYWNGAINWFISWGIGDSVFYNVDEERFGVIPLPPIPEGNDWRNREFRNYGESRGHLHLVEFYDGTRRVDVYEMERDYSRWFLKSSVDLDAVGIPRDTRFCPFSILCVVRMERDEESFLVLHVPGKILRYTFVDGTLKKICAVPIPSNTRNRSWSRSFQYIESLYVV